MSNVVEQLRKELVSHGMRPAWLGLRKGRAVEFLTFPWQAGQELFVLVRRVKTGREEVVGADEVEPLGERNGHGRA